MLNFLLLLQDSPAYLMGIHPSIYPPNFSLLDPGSGGGSSPIKDIQTSLSLDISSSSRGRILRHSQVSPMTQSLQRVLDLPWGLLSRELFQTQLIQLSKLPQLAPLDMEKQQLYYSFCRVAELLTLSVIPCSHHTILANCLFLSPSHFKAGQTWVVKVAHPEDASQTVVDSGCMLSIQLGWGAQNIEVTHSSGRAEQLFSAAASFHYIVVHKRPGGLLSASESARAFPLTLLVSFS